MTEPDEVARLQAEVTALRAALAVRRRHAGRLTAVRGVLAATLIALAALGFVASVVGLWAARTALDTDRWTATVAPLPADPPVAAAVAEYTTTEVFRLLDVQQRLADALPERAAFVAGPVTGEVRDYVRRTIDTALRSDRFQAVWVEANRRAHQQALAILNGTSTVVAAQADRVSIDLLPLINEALRTLSAQLPALFGRQISLPDLHSGQIPENLRTVVGNAVGVTLPENFAQFTVYDGGRLRALQQGLVTAKRAVALLTIGTLVLLITAVWLSPRRRRTVLQFGVWLVVAAVAVTAVLRAVRTQLVEQVPAGTYRDGVSAAITTVVATLRERGEQIIWLGVIIACVAYLVGPGRFPTRLRRAVIAAAESAGRALRRGGAFVAANGPGWVGRHLDALRIAGVAVAAVLALLLSSWGALAVVVALLVLYELALMIFARRGSHATDEADLASAR